MENSFSILDDEFVTIGVGIYFDAALLNHSYTSNCILVFEDSKLLVKCIKDIKKDQEVGKKKKLFLITERF